MTRDSATACAWDDLQVFAAVAASGTLAGAAARLGVDHSTVLRRIAALERAMDTRLFERLREGYALTPAGESLAEGLQGLEQRVDAARRNVMGIDEAIEGAIKVSASDVVVESVLVPALADFRRAHPAVHMTVEATYAMVGLSSHEGDIAVRGADQAPAGLLAACVGAIETVACAAREYLDTADAPRALADHRWLALDRSLGFARQRSWFASLVPERNVVARFDSIVAMADACAAGLGVAFMPRPLAAARAGLREISPPIDGLRVPIWVLMHPDVQRVARMRALFDHLVHALGTSPRLAHGD